MVVIGDMVPGDWDAVRVIYEQGLASGDATFNTQAPPSWDAWSAGHLPAPRLVARDEDRVVGWAALSPVQRKSAYRGVAEGSIYVAAGVRREGVARSLGERMIALSEEQGIWTIEAWIFPENEISIRLCEQLGFREVGVRRQIGRREGIWRDVVVLERRSDRPEYA
jgi:phosphinothricin acetyltransferase